MACCGIFSCSMSMLISRHNSEFLKIVAFNMITKHVPHMYLLLALKKETFPC